jgi:CubicO group peptidase (beta-lactamase class C family)
VRELLTMTSGVRWNEDYTDPESDVAQMYDSACVDDEAHVLPYRGLGLFLDARSPIICG